MPMITRVPTHSGGLFRSGFQPTVNSSYGFLAFETSAVYLACNHHRHNSLAGGSGLESTGRTKFKHITGSF
uniref:Uncharacterized protein n=1 Tax=Helianthus annuus TaxID=4232 RepID=A0A251RTJ6_HELAN